MGQGSYVRYYKQLLSVDELEMTEDEAIKAAEDYLKSKKLLPDGFKYSRSSATTRINSTGEKITTAITVAFTRELDDCPVLGVSKINVTYNSEGLREVILAYSDYSKKSKVKAMSYDEFVKALYGDDVIWIVMEENAEGMDVDKIKIEDIQIAYIDISNSASSKYIQPYFSVYGTLEGDVETEFQALVPALPESFYARHLGIIRSCTCK